MRLTSRRAVLREHPELKRGGWKDIQVPAELRAKFPKCAKMTRFTIDQYVSVQVYELETTWGQVLHLLVRPHDETPIRNWYSLQRVKNDVVGDDRVAVEVFPREADLVDAGVAIYHLWVLPKDFELPFGMHLPGGGML